MKKITANARKISGLLNKRFSIFPFALRGYVIEKTDGNGSIIGEDYFEHLLAEIREICLSERR